MILVGDSPNELPLKAENKTRFVCVSDTHGKTAFNFPIPDGDVFSKYLDTLTHRGKGAITDQLGIPNSSFR